jgi:hypothetical protein
MLCSSELQSQRRTWRIRIGRRDPGMITPTSANPDDDLNLRDGGANHIESPAALVACT